MKPNAVKTFMIKRTVEKGIKEITYNPKRGIRNLAEFGEMFANGRFQREFFHVMVDQLEDSCSAYFHIVENIVTWASTEALTTFGINLGYNALVHGASIIRDIEASEDFNVPWCLTIDAGNGKNMLLPADVKRIMAEGEELGIYCYLVNLDKDYPHCEEMVQALGDAKNCAVVLFCHHKSINTPFCDLLIRAKNVAVALDMDYSDLESLTGAARLLLATGNVSGGFSRVSQLDAKDVSSRLLDKPERIGLPIMIFVRIKKHHLSEADDVYRQFINLRKQLDAPVLPIDLYDDIAHADRAISSEPCLVAVMGDGSLILNNVDMDKQIVGCSIHEASLREIFSKTMQKKRSM